MMPATLHNQSKIKLNSRELGYVVVSYNTTESVNLAVQMYVLADASSTLPYYRFKVMVAKAIEIVRDVQQVGESFYLKQ